MAVTQPINNNPSSSVQQQSSLFPQHPQVKQNIPATTMALGAPRAGPYFAPRISTNVLAKAGEDTQRLEARVEHLEALNKELKDENEKLVVEAKEKDIAMNELSETIERLKMTMEGGRN